MRYLGRVPAIAATCICKQLARMALVSFLRQRPSRWPSSFPVYTEHSSVAFFSVIRSESRQRSFIER